MTEIRKEYGRVMQISRLVFVHSVLFGIGLAVDAFLVALSNGMCFPNIHKRKIFGVAISFSLFQFAAPMIGWVIAHTAFLYFDWIELCFAWMAFFVIIMLAVRLVVECLRGAEVHTTKTGGVLTFFMQCAATSVDALTVGFTIEEYGVVSALICSAVIAAITFAAYPPGFVLGRRFGLKFDRAAKLVGGLVFIAIAIEIIVTTYTQ